MLNRKTLYSISKYLGLVLPALWLIYSASVLDIEYFDGYDAIINSYYFSGDTPLYIAYKAPLMGLILVPAHILSQFCDLNPLDLRIYHFEMVFLHIAYLIAVYLIMERRVGKKIAVVISFAATIPTFVFFSYSPFISIDIFPGLFFILMIILTDRFINRIKISQLILLIIIGAVSALIKPTYGVFWLAIILAQSLLLISSKEWNWKSWRPCIFLIAGSFFSFILYWIVMCFVLKNSFPQINLIFKPLEQIRTMTVENRQQGVFPWWLYIRNFPFYGLLTTLLIIPGIVMGIRSKDQFYKLLALCWLISFFILHLFFLREVRYMAFLAPLSAFLLIKPMQFLMKKPRYLVLILILLLIDFSFSAMEACRLSEKFYQKSQTKEFLFSMSNSESRDINQNSSFIMNNFICFMPPGKKVFPGDRFHRKFHFGPYHMKVLYCPAKKLKWLPENASFRQKLTYKPFSYLLYSTFLPVNSSHFWKNGKSDLSKYLLCSAISEQINLKKSKCKVFRDTETGNIIIEKENMEKVLVGFIFPVLYNLTNNKKFIISQTGKRTIEIEKSQDLDLAFFSKDNYKFMGYKILCYININSDAGTDVNIKKAFKDDIK